MKNYHSIITISLCCLGLLLLPALCRPAQAGRPQHKMYLQSITFTGNRHFPDRQLQAVMRLKTRGFLTWFTDQGVWKSDLLHSALDRLADFYRKRGFLDVRVGPARLSRRTNKIYLHIRVIEGRRYRVAGVAVAGNVLTAQTRLKTLLQLKTGAYFSQRSIQHDSDALSEFYRNRGYPAVEVQPSISKNSRTHTATVLYAIRPGDAVRIGTIAISGNTRTNDAVIRRQLLLAEGDPFSEAKLKQSIENLRHLNCLKDAAIVPAPDNPPGVMNLQVRVKEKAPVTLLASGGYSSDDGAFGSAQIVLPDLFGDGQYLGLRAYLAQKARQYMLSYTAPWLFGSSAGGGFDVYDWRRQYTDFTADVVGFRLRSRISFGRWSTLDCYYALEDAKVTDVAAGASPILTDQEGRQIKSSISLVVTRDTIDNVLLPTRGSRNSLSVEYASPYLGSDSDFVKVDAESGWYLPLWWKLVGSWRGEAGWIVQPDDNRPAPLYERFFLGGMNSLRAFDWASVGPKDAAGNVVGGVKYAFTDVALLFPLLQRFKLRGMVFFDAGNAFSTDQSIDVDKFKTDAGVGVVWNSPFGPFQIDWARNLDRENGEPSSKWQFSVGALF